MAMNFDVEDTNERTRKAIAGVKKIRQNLVDSQEEAARTFKKNTRQAWEPLAARRPPTNKSAIKMTETAPKVRVPLLGVLHKGGLVPKTGDYSVQEGEEVIPAHKVSAAEKLGKGKSKFEKPHRMIVDHNDDDSFSITHQFKPKEEGAAPPKDKKFSARNARALVRHVRQVWGGE